MTAPSGTTRDRGSARSGLGRTTLCAGAGLLSGALGAYSYYDPFLRPLAHTFGLWLILVVAVAAGRPVRPAVSNATAALVTAVVAFYVGKKVMYALRYPGMPYPLDYSGIALWVVLAIAAGVGLGWAFHRIGRPGWAGAAATATAAGLLIADALHRGNSYRDDIPLTAGVTIVGLALLVALTRRDRESLPRSAVLVVPATLGALLLVSAPDVVEHLVFIGY